jgi:multisubunit Na+/H+ antiporter MnhB subunit
LVRGALDEAGVGQPVTAVLLNLRGYDTLLELVVMLLAALGVRVLAGGCRWRWSRPRR